MSDIISISRLRTGTDGKGITTLIGLYGCPLKCKYCINKDCNSNDIMRADYTAEELVAMISIDEPYFLMTGGGVTFGGGEPLIQAEFIHEVCQLANKKWKKNIETSLNVPWEQIELVIDDIDYWFIDIKDIDNKIYNSYTGYNNEQMLENLMQLVDRIDNNKICIRIPLIKGFNTLENQRRSVEFIREYISKDVELDLFEYICF